MKQPKPHKLSLLSQDCLIGGRGSEANLGSHDFKSSDLSGFTLSLLERLVMQIIRIVISRSQSGLMQESGGPELKFNIPVHLS